MRKIQLAISLPRSGIAVRIAEVRDEDRARDLARKVLAESPEHLEVAVWEGDERLFTIVQPGGPAP